MFFPMLTFVCFQLNIFAAEISTIFFRRVNIHSYVWQLTSYKVIRESIFYFVGILFALFSFYLSIYLFILYPTLTSWTF